MHIATGHDQHDPTDRATPGFLVLPDCVCTCKHWRVWPPPSTRTWVQRGWCYPHPQSQQSWRSTTSPRVFRQFRTRRNGIVRRSNPIGPIPGRELATSHPRIPWGERMPWRYLRLQNVQFRQQWMPTIERRAKHYKTDRISTTAKSLLEYCTSWQIQCFR